MMLNLGHRELLFLFLQTSSRVAPRQQQQTQGTRLFYRADHFPHTLNFLPDGTKSLLHKSHMWLMRFGVQRQRSNTDNIHEH